MPARFFLLNFEPTSAHPAGSQRTEATPSNGTCFSLQYSDQNCGACGKACPAGQRCQKGVCVPR